MLVLTRKVKEQIDLIYQGQLLCTVEVVRIAGNRATVGFEGMPDTLTILRREIVERERKELEPAA